MEHQFQRMKNRKKTNKEREDEAAKRFKAKRVSGSGAPVFSKKEDLWNERFLFQHKETSQGSHSITRRALRNLRQNAIDNGLEAAYIVNWGEELGEWVMVEKVIFDELNQDS